MKTPLSVRIIILLSAIASYFYKLHKVESKKKIDALSARAIELHEERTVSHVLCIGEIRDARIAGEELAHSMREAALSKSAAAIAKTIEEEVNNNRLHNLLLTGA